jgi:hypothetical protein
MKTARLITLVALVLALSTASGAWAVDEGQTKPRLNNGTVASSNTAVDIIPLTNGSGNIKGVQCLLSPGTGFFPNLRIHFYVDGAAAETINPADAIYLTDASGDLYTDVIPMNIRFGTSIRVNLQRLASGGTGGVQCVVSWGLD